MLQHRNAQPAEAAESDRDLLALAAEIRATVNTFNAGFECEAPDCKPSDLKALERAAFNRINVLIDRMAAIPAAGFAGVAAKAGWLCEILAQSGFLIAEAELVDSLAADLARHQPDAVAARTRG
jgi:hypothetical protein